MKLFSCSNCQQAVYFENTFCIRCGYPLGFVPSDQQMYAFEIDENNQFQIKSSLPDSRHFKPCRNYDVHQVCNWGLEAEEPSDFCLACQLNRTIPELTSSANIDLWRKMEIEKRRLVYSLQALSLPIESLLQTPTGMAFDFLADTPATFSEKGRVITGHSGGVITINLNEADPVQRESMRSQMAEPYRTLQGHFRHESGHYYWERLVRDSHWLDQYRLLFGDERLDYGVALEQHYHNGAPADWQSSYISEYASSHPWEDWAETWAHYLHMVDTLETAMAFGLTTHPMVSGDGQLTIAEPLNPLTSDNFESLLERWLPLTNLVNSLNRSLGHKHAYPFVLSPAVIDKLRFVHQVVRSWR